MVLFKEKFGSAITHSLLPLQGGGESKMQLQELGGWV
jgi:hypothetical protein